MSTMIEEARDRVRSVKSRVSRRKVLTVAEALERVREERSMPSEFHCPVCGTIYRDKGSAATRDKRWHWCRTGTLDRDHDFIPNETNTDLKIVYRPTKISCLAAFRIEKSDRGVWRAVEINHPSRIGKAVR